MSQIGKEGAINKNAGRIGPSRNVKKALFSPDWRVVLIPLGRLNVRKKEKQAFKWLYWPITSIHFFSNYREFIREENNKSFQYLFFSESWGRSFGTQHGKDKNVAHFNIFFLSKTTTISLWDVAILRKKTSRHQVFFDRDVNKQLKRFSSVPILFLLNTWCSWLSSGVCCC